MIEASFDADRSAAASGAYQHDRGQRIRLRGLPPPDVLSQMDELVNCDAVTVQVHYAYAGDSQTEARLAVWDDIQGVWTAAVPDVYMTRCEDVHVYVYIHYGQDEDGQRAKTCYEAVFRPASRPAPGDSVTPGQVNAWDALVQEVNLAIASTNSAAALASGEATAAREATERADAAAAAARSAASEAVDTANQAADWLRGITATAATLEPGAQASVVLSDGEAGPVLAIGVPEGIQGIPGRPGVATINGISVTDEGSVTLTAQDVGAREADWMPTAQDVGAMDGELLWENLSPTTAMAEDDENASSIQVDWTGFTHALVIYLFQCTQPTNRMSSICMPIAEGNVCMLMSISGVSDVLASRHLTITAQGMRVGAGSMCAKGEIQTATATVNKYCIPRYIYGIRGVREHG